MVKTGKQETKKGFSGLLSQEKSAMPLFILISLAVQGVSLFFIVILTFGLIRLAYRPLPSLVQTEDGTISVRAAPSYYREPALIKEFVALSSQNLFTWSAVMQVTDEEGKSQKKRDEGVVVGKNLKVPTPAYESSFVLSEDFRLDFLEKLAQLIPPTIWKGKAQALVKFVHIGEPESIGQGEWKVKQIAHLILQDAEYPQGRAIPLNKEFYVRAVDTPPLPPDEMATPWQKLVYQIRQSRLEISKIKDLNRD